MRRPSVVIPQTMKGKIVTFYTVAVDAGRTPPVKRLLDLTPDTLYVIVMDKKSVMVN